MEFSISGLPELETSMVCLFFSMHATGWKPIHFLGASSSFIFVIVMLTLLCIVIVNLQAAPLISLINYVKHIRNFPHCHEWERQIRGWIMEFDWFLLFQFMVTSPIGVGICIFCWFPPCLPVWQLAWGGISNIISHTCFHDSPATWLPSDHLRLCLNPFWWPSCCSLVTYSEFAATACSAAVSKPVVFFWIDSLSWTFKLFQINK